MIDHAGPKLYTSIMKKAWLLAGLALILISTLALFGCSSTSSTAATTTTAAGGITTTTLPGTGAAMISGTITLPAGGLAGNLWVGANTDATLMAISGWKEENLTVTAGDTSVDYSLPVGGASGTYYICAVLAVGRSSFDGTPVSGDRVGEYADGKITSGWGKSPAGTPTPIVYNAGDAVIGNDFDLKVTW